MSEVLEEKFEEVIEMNVQIPVDICEYIHELKTGLNCSESEAIIYLLDVAIDAISNAVEEDDENPDMDNIKSMLDIDDDLKYN